MTQREFYCRSQQLMLADDLTPAGVCIAGYLWADLMTASSAEGKG